MIKQTAIKSVFLNINAETLYYYINHSLYRRCGGSFIQKIIFQILSKIRTKFLLWAIQLLFGCFHTYVNRHLPTIKFTARFAVLIIFLKTNFCHMKESGIYNFLYDNVGIAYYAHHNNLPSPFIRQCVISLNQLNDSDLWTISGFDVATMHPYVSMVNIRSAQDISSIIILWLKDFNICRLRETASLAMKIISNLKGQKNPDGLNSVFSRVIQSLQFTNVVWLGITAI